MPDVANTPVTIRDAFVEFKRIRLRGKSMTTINRYGYSLDKLDKYLQRRAVFSDLNNDTFIDFMDWMSKDLKLSPRSVNNVRGYLCSLWRYLHRNGLAATGPDVPTVPQSEEVPRAFTREEIDRLILSARCEEGMLAGTPASIWWEALIRAAFETGERAGAILQWKWSMINLDTGFINAPGNVRKGGRKAKSYRLRKPTVDLLLQFQRHRNQIIFLWPNHGTSLYNSFDRIAKRAAVPRGRKFKFHCLRKSHASYLTLAGGDATESLGHCQHSLTKETYLDPTICQTRTWSDLLPEVGGAPQSQPPKGPSDSTSEKAGAT